MSATPYMHDSAMMAYIVPVPSSLFERAVAWFVPVRPITVEYDVLEFGYPGPDAASSGRVLRHTIRGREVVP